MLLNKIVKINIEAERERINTPKLYNKQERNFLNGLVNLFEKGEFNKCIELIQSVNKDWAEYIGCEIHDVLWDIRFFGLIYEVRRDK